MWPLHEGALSASDLRPFAPLNYGTLAQAFHLGVIDVRVLVEGFRSPGFAVTPPSSWLKTFLLTSQYLDRERDVGEELRRLSRHDDVARPKLWMILARLILSRYPDHDEALRVLQETFQELGAPMEMRPHTLYGGAPADATPRSSESLVARLDAYLSRMGT